MLRFILRRVVVATLTLLAASLLLFALVRLLPGDAVRGMFGFGRPPDAAMEAVRERLGHDQPFLVQWGRFMTDFATLDFGESMQGESVRGILAATIGPTLWILSGVAVLQVLLGPALLWMSARRPRSRLDRWTAAATVVLVSIPTLVAAFLLQAILVYWTDLLPSPDWIYAPDPNAGWRNYVMPILALGLGTAAHLAMVGRVELLAVLATPYIVTARAFGIPPDRILKVEAARPAAGAAVQVLAANLAVLLTGLIVVEDVFGVPGLAAALLQAIEDQDRILMLTMLLLVLTAVMVVNTAADVVHGMIDPRVRDAGS